MYEIWCTDAVKSCGPFSQTNNNRIFVCSQKEISIHTNCSLFHSWFMEEGLKEEKVRLLIQNTHTHKTQKSAPPQPKPPHLLTDTCIIVFVSLQTDFSPVYECVYVCFSQSSDVIKG